MTSLTVFAVATLVVGAEPAPEFKGSAEPIPPAIAETMKKYSWREGCPVPLDGLSYVKVNHWGYDGKVHDGELIIAKELGSEVVDIFRELFAAKFPVQQMKLVDAYNGSDDASMDDNNTSSFNCRWMTGKKGVFSNHSWGRAIDVNPLTNPYVTKKITSPKAGEPYRDRTKPATGLITAETVIYKSFTSRGWAWGGSWKSPTDYQHFEKPEKK